MKTVFCVFKQSSLENDPLIWVCSSFDKALDMIRVYGKPNEFYYTTEEIIEEVMAGKVVA